MNDQNQGAPDDGPGSDNHITMFMHCGMCVEEKPGSESPENWARLSVGWTKRGIQVWCVRHNCNVLHVDFEGAQHPVNTRRRA